MKKIISGVILSGILLGASAPVLATELGKVDGTTTLEITDYTVDPQTGLPSDPGAFTLNEVPNIDFGKHSLDSIQDTNHQFNGVYQGNLTITDTRPTQPSITAAKDIIDKAQPIEGKLTQGEIDAAKQAWDKAIAASPWRIDAKATDLSGIGSSLKIGTVEVLTAGGTIVKETATAPVGTKGYLATLGDPVLTIANNQLSIQTYQGTIRYSAVNAL